MKKEDRIMSEIRNFGIMAHIDAGKTTVTERMLFITGKIYKIGEVHDGTATMDWMEQERDRGITITSAATSFKWNKHDFHLIDTPGHVDFTMEVERSLRVLDGAIAVFDAVHGVETQSETVWMQADKFHVPRIAFINKLDRLGANFDKALISLEKHFQQTMIPVQIPVGRESDFSGVIDLITGKQVKWAGDDPLSMETFDSINPQYQDKMEQFRELMLERISDQDDQFCEKYLSGDEISADDIRSAIRKVTLAGLAVPVLCGAALRNRGIQPLMDAVEYYLPSPLDMPPIKGINPKTKETIIRNNSASDPFSALVFKVMMMEDGRRMSFLRIYSGKLQVKSAVHNAGKNIDEKISRIFTMHSNHRQRIDSISAGNIVSVLGLKKSMTGDTLCERKHPILLEAIGTYIPVIKMAIEPVYARDRDKLLEALSKFIDEDPTFNYFEDSETGQTLIEGMGELHLDVIADRIKKEFKIEVMLGKPQVVYKETVTTTASAKGTVDRKSDEGHLFAGVALTVKPGERNSGVNIESRISAEKPISSDIIEVIKEGILDSLTSGAAEGFEVSDILILIDDVESLPGEKNPVAYKMATSIAIENALSKAHCVLTEPLMILEVHVSEEFLGVVIADIQSRKGQIEEITEGETGYKTVRALVPFKNLIGYAMDARSLSQGKISFSIRFKRYDIVRS